MASDIGNFIIHFDALLLFLQGNWLGKCVNPGCKEMFMLYTFHVQFSSLLSELQYCALKIVLLSSVFLNFQLS